MEFLGFKSMKADPDVWMREAVKPDGIEYWEFVLLYVDDCLVISHRGEQVIRDEIGKYFKFKEKSIGRPDIYLVGKLREVELRNGVNAWSFSSSKYVQEAIKNVKSQLAKMGLTLPKGAKVNPRWRKEKETSGYGITPYLSLAVDYVFH